MVARASSDLSRRPIESMPSRSSSFLVGFMSLWDLEALVCLVLCNWINSQEWAKSLETASTLRSPWVVWQPQRAVVVYGFCENKPLVDDLLTIVRGAEQPSDHCLIRRCGNPPRCGSASKLCWTRLEIAPRVPYLTANLLVSLVPLRSFISAPSRWQETDRSHDSVSGGRTSPTPTSNAEKLRCNVELRSVSNRIEARHISCLIIVMKNHHGTKTRR